MGVITLGRIASWLIVLTLIDQIATIVVDWQNVGSDTFVEFPTTLQWIDIVIWSSAVVVFIAWLWRARTRAERSSAAPHRHGRGWVIGSWFCPVVNLWLPREIVQDVVLASVPAGMPVDRGPIRLVNRWWLVFVGFNLLVGPQTIPERTADDPGAPLAAALIATVGLVLMVAAAVLAVRLIAEVEWLQAEMERSWTTVGSSGVGG